jgi:hypothetical protein
VEFSFPRQPQQGQLRATGDPLWSLKAPPSSTVRRLVADEPGVIRLKSVRCYATGASGIWCCCASLSGWRCGSMQGCRNNGVVPPLPDCLDANLLHTPAREIEQELGLQRVIGLFD